MDIATQEALFDLVVECAKTPIEERKEEEKKYYVKLSWLGEDSQYLNFNKSTGTYFTVMKDGDKIFKNKFTMEEIEKLKEKYNLDNFVIVGVEE